MTETRPLSMPPPMTSPWAPRACAVLCAVLCATFSAGITFGQAGVSSDAISGAVAGMGSGDRERVMAARQALISQLSGKDKAVLENYARDLSVALAPIIAGNDPHAKLNAAIVVGRVADLSGSTSLAGLAAKLVQDPSPAIAAYGLRASASLLPRLLAGAQADTNTALVPAILDAVQKNPQSEAIAGEAYSAMTRVLLDTRGAAALLGAPAVSQATPRTVDALHQLIAIRVKQMGRNELAEPAAEQPAISFLGRQTTWALSTPPQQMRTIGAMLDIMNGAVAELESIPADKLTGAARERALALRNIVKGTGQSLAVISELLSKPELKATAQFCQQLGAATPPAEYRRVVTAIQADFTKAFPDLRPAGATTQTTQARS